MPFQLAFVANGNVSGRVLAAIFDLQEEGVEYPVEIDREVWITQENTGYATNSNHLTFLCAQTQATIASIHFELIERDELIWAAGLFAGEGSVWISGKWGSNRAGALHLGLMMLDGRSVYRFAAALTPYMPSREGPWKNKPPVPVTFDRKFTRVHVGGRRAYAAASLLLYYLLDTDKGDQIAMCLDKCPDLAEPISYGERWAARRIKFGPSGFSPDGILTLRETMQETNRRLGR